MTKSQWQKEICLKWIWRHRRDIAEFFIVAALAILLGIATTR